MAEREGFEPSIRLPVYTRSRRAPSTTRPPLRSRRRRGLAAASGGGRPLAGRAAGRKRGARAGTAACGRKVAAAASGCGPRARTGWTTRRVCPNWVVKAVRFGGATARFEETGAGRCSFRSSAGARRRAGDRRKTSPALRMVRPRAGPGRPRAWRMSSWGTRPEAV